MLDTVSEANAVRRTTLPQPVNLDGPNAVDLHVGRAIRTRRRDLGLSQAKLAEALGLTFQQVQKYERGANRVSASKLFQIAVALDCHPGDFFPVLDGKSVRLTDSAATMALSPTGAAMQQIWARLPADAQKALLNTAGIILQAGV